MSNRMRRNPVIPVPTHKCGDKSRLLWERYQGAMQAAANQLNAAIRNTESILAGVIIEAEGFSTDTHILNTDNLTIIPRPAVKGDNGVGERG